MGIFQQTPLGKFLAKLSVGQQRELLQCYLKDFLLLSMKVSAGKELAVSLGWGSVKRGHVDGMQTQDLTLTSEAGAVFVE